MPDNSQDPKTDEQKLNEGSAEVTESSDEVIDESALDQNLDGSYSGRKKSGQGEHGAMYGNDAMHGTLRAAPGGQNDANSGGKEMKGSTFFLRGPDGLLQMVGNPSTVPALDEYWQALETVEATVAEKAQMMAHLRGRYHAINDLPPDARRKENPALDQPLWIIQGNDPPGGEIELFQTHSCILQTESYDKESGVMRVRGTATTANVINTKRQVYPIQVWQDNIPRLKRMLDQGKLLGECDHPIQGRASLDRTCLKFTELWLDGNEIKFKADVIPTEPYGRNVTRLIQAGVPVDISSRGRGKIERGTWNDIPDVDVIQRGFRCDAFDLVVAGSSPNSRIENWEMAQSDTPATPEEEMPELMEQIAEQLKALSQQNEALKADINALKDAPAAGAGAGVDQAVKEHETSRMDRMESLLVRERIESLVQEQAQKLPNQWLNMYRKLLANSGGSTVDSLELYAETALKIVQDTMDAAPKFPGRGFVVQQDVGKRGPQTPRELIEELISDLPDDVPGGPLSKLRQSQEDETVLGVPDHIRSPRRQMRRILTNIATHKSSAWDGPAAMRGLMMLEQGYGAETVTEFLDQACADGTTSVGAGGAPQSAIFVFPLVRRVFPQLIATELASVQPMDRPDGKIFYLDTYRRSPGIDTTDEGGTNVVDRTRMDISSSFNSSYADDPGECEVSQLIQLRLSSKSVTVQTKKLHAVWSIEELQDLRAYHGLDVASELVSALSREIALEWNQIVLQELLDGAAGNSTYNTTAPSGYTQKEWDEYLSRYIMKASNEIFKRRHGDMTHVIAGPDAWLKIAASFRVGTNNMTANPDLFAGLTLTPFMMGSNVNVKTYKTSFWNGVNTNKILVIRRGSDWSDTPYVWAPYIDYVSPTLTLPDVFTQKQGVMSRAAHKVVVRDSIETVTISAGTGIAL